SPWSERLATTWMKRGRSGTTAAGSTNGTHERDDDVSATSLACRAVCPLVRGPAPARSLRRIALRALAHQCVGNGWRLAWARVELVPAARAGSAFARKLP